jgi:dihydrofolate reductase
MASIRLYVAISIDGFIADAQGSVEWLEAYPPVPVAFSRFIDGVGTIVSGRTTYDNGRDRGWPAAPQTIVVTSRRTSPPTTARSTRSSLACSTPSTNAMSG